MQTLVLLCNKKPNKLLVISSKGGNPVYRSLDKVCLRFFYGTIKTKVLKPIQCSFFFSDLLESNSAEMFAILIAQEDMAPVLYTHIKKHVQQFDLTEDKVNFIKIQVYFKKSYIRSNPEINMSCLEPLSFAGKEHRTI